MTKDDFAAIMWAGFVQWAASEPYMRAAFKDGTGLVLLPPPATPIEAMVDEATGAARNTAAFIEWVTREHWGLDEAPQSYRNALGEPKVTGQHPQDPAQC